jgi:hypothetical protein
MPYVQFSNVVSGVRLSFAFLAAQDRELHVMVPFRLWNPLNSLRKRLELGRRPLHLRMKRPNSVGSMRRSRESSVASRACQYPSNLESPWCRPTPRVIAVRIFYPKAEVWRWLATSDTCPAPTCRWTAAWWKPMRRRRAAFHGSSWEKRRSHLSDGRQMSWAPDIAAAKSEEAEMKIIDSPLNFNFSLWRGAGEPVSFCFPQAAHIATGLEATSTRHNLDPSYE